jgi:hypothetical protein
MFNFYNQIDTLADAAKGNNIGGLSLIRLVGYKAEEKDAFETALKQAKLGKKTCRQCRSRS